MTTTTSPEAYIYDGLNGLDLTQVMAQAKATYGWDDATATTAESCYRDFLWVCWNVWNDNKEPLAAISALADKVWHCHMLLPQKYNADCVNIFGGGYILDHEPNLPNVGSVDAGAEEAAKAEYAKLGKPVPADLRNRCIWAVVEP